MALRRRLLIAAQPLHGGVANHVVDLVEGLPDAEYTVHVACPRRSSIWRRLEDRGGVVLHPIGAAREPALADVQSLMTLTRLIRRADVVHAHSSKAGFLARLAAALVGATKRCVFTPHVWSFWAARAAPEARLYLGLERLAAHWCNRIVAVSDAERAAGLAAGVGREAQYEVILNGIDLDRFEAPVDRVPGRLVAVGRLARQKRMDVLIRAFASVLQTFPRAELQIVGDGPDRSAVEALIGNLGLNGAVQLLGARDDIPLILSRASCFVLASDYESCPLSVMEAMAAGIPVVATAVGGVPELVASGREGLLVEAGSPQPLAQALAVLLDDPGRARRMGEEGRRTARRRFSRARMVERIQRLYEEVPPR